MLIQIYKSIDPQTGEMLMAGTAFENDEAVLATPAISVLHFISGKACEEHIIHTLKSHPDYR